MTQNIKKFNNKYITAAGEQRAFIEMKELNFLWFNTGTLCNIQCKGCYMESSPTNDQLLYIDLNDVENYLLQIIKHKLPVRNIGFTGGEPFMNKDIIKILITCLEQGFNVLVLTNAMQPLINQSKNLHNLKKYKNLSFRVSLDHYSKIKHENIRGQNTWEKTLEGINLLENNNLYINIASRFLWKDESEEEIRCGFKKLFKNIKVNINAHNKEELVLFPEMNFKYDVPEITSSCWKKLNKDPNNIMCASSRMIVKRKSTKTTSIVPCTLLPYEISFELGPNLVDSQKKVYLNHVHCAKFCVLGGGNCKG